jgi:hypothetical protein
MNWPAGTAFDELGRGAMGITYKAFDTVLEHAVALKVMTPHRPPRSAGTFPARSPPPRGFGTRTSPRSFTRVRKVTRNALARWNW